MLRRPLVIVFFFVLAALLWWLFQISRPLPGLESKGGPESLAPWIALAASIVSLITGIVTLALKLTEMRAGRPRRNRA